MIARGGIRVIDDRNLRPGCPEEPWKVGKHLIRRRLDLKLTQKEAARELGVSHKTHGYWEQGRTEPKVRHYPGIVRFLGYDPAPVDPALSIGERSGQPDAREVSRW